MLQFRLTFVCYTIALIDDWYFMTMRVVEPKAGPKDGVEGVISRKFMELVD